MMNSDKERIIEEENAAKVPRTEVYTKRIIHTTQKPWFWQSCGVCLGLVALTISLAALIAFMGWRTYVRPNFEDELPIDTRDSDEYLMRKACYQPKDPGSCMDIVPRWHFDPSLGRCLQFEYGGCEGNENNFATERECHHRCIRSEDDYITIPDNEMTGIVITEDPKPSTDPKPVKQDDHCLYQVDPGTCRGSFERYYFDNKSGECHMFLYGGCDGNRNNFESQAKCEESCKPHPQNRGRDSEEAEDDPCQLESDIGPCRASLARYFFNSQSGKCEMFVYGGCAGNRNNFESVDDCQKNMLQPFEI